jgi:hypothetical protein
MIKNFGIKNKVDLYKRLTPALNCKIRELEKESINVRKEDIWNFLVKTMWNKRKGLELSGMVDDILNLDNNKLISFINENQSNKDSQEEKENEIELL